MTDDESWDDIDSDEEWDEVNYLDDINIINKDNITCSIKADSLLIVHYTINNKLFESFKLKIIFNEKLKIINTIIEDEITSKCLHVDEVKFLKLKMEKILRTLDLTNDFLSEIIIRMDYYFTTSSKLCYICNKKCIINTNNLNFCGDLICITNSCMFNFELFNEISFNSHRFEFMLYLFMCSIYENRMPCILPKDTNLKEVIKLLSKLKSIKINDINELDPDLTGLLSWLVVSYKNKIDVDLIINDNSDKKILIFENAPAENILIRHHGSRDFNYFNIIMNGLKNFSKTKYMSTGAAFGDGVYFGSKTTAISYNIRIAKSQDNKLYTLISESQFFTKSKILECMIYHEDEKWTNTEFCTVIPKNDNIIIQKMILQ